MCGFLGGILEGLRRHARGNYNFLIRDFYIKIKILYGDEFFLNARKYLYRILYLSEYECLE